MFYSYILQNKPFAKTLFEKNGLRNKPSPNKNLQENSLQNKPSPKKLSKKTVYKTSLSPKHFSKKPVTKQTFTKQKSLQPEALVTQAGETISHLQTRTPHTPDYPLGTPQSARYTTHFSLTVHTLRRTPLHNPIDILHFFTPKSQLSHSTTLHTLSLLGISLFCSLHTPHSALHPIPHSACYTRQQGKM